MNIFKVGDRVIFLNERGGGIITKVIDDQIVHVSVEDGFEIPYAVKDLLRSVEGGYDDTAGSVRHIAEENENPDMKPLFYIHNKPDQLAEGVYMAFIPEDQDQVLKSRLEPVLINHCQHQLLYSIYLNRSGTFHGFDFGYADPESYVSLGSIDRNEIEDWANGLVQAVFFGEGKSNPLEPASATISFKPVKIYKHDSFSYEPLLRKTAMIIELTTIEKQARKLRLDDMVEVRIEKTADQQQEEPFAKNQPLQQEGFLDKHKVDDKIAEVDLHIGELAENYSRLSNAEILKIQMDYFRECMEEARNEKLSKVIFIHGVGNGTLKNELLRFLRQSEGIDFYDASFARYGMGATEVMFYRHR